MDLQGGSAAGLQGGSGARVQNAAGTPQRAAGTPTLQGGSANAGTLQSQNLISSTANYIKNAQAGVNQTNNELASIEQQIQAEIQAQRPPVSQTLNINAIKSAAAKAANSQVNPLYTQQLHEYLQNEAANKQAQQAQNQMNLSGYQADLGNTLAQNTQAQQYAGEQNSMTQGNINAQASNYQLNSGNAETQKIAALQQSVGQGGLAGSGMGSQQLFMAENQKNVEDAQQQGTFQYNRDVANLATQNTFAQLAQSSAFAQTQEKEQEAQSNFNLNSYLRQAAYSQQQYQNALGAWKQQAINAAQSNNIASALSNQINNISNAGVRGATEQAYSSYLGGSAAPSMVNQLSYQP